MKLKDYKTRRHLLKENKNLRRDMEMFQKRLSSYEAENETLTAQICALREQNRKLSIKVEALKIIHLNSKKSCNSSEHFSVDLEYTGHQSISQSTLNIPERQGLYK